MLSIQPDEGPCLRCVFPDPPPPGALPTCDTAGVLGPAVGAIASMQAGLALRQLSGAEPAAPALIDLDVWSGSARRLPVPRAPGCPCCVERRFEFLEGATADDAVSLCGRNTVQVLPPPGPPPPLPISWRQTCGPPGSRSSRQAPSFDSPPTGTA